MEPWKVTVDTGHKWLWINGVWKDCGIYQAAGVAGLGSIKNLDDLKYLPVKGINAVAGTDKPIVFKANGQSEETSSTNFSGDTSVATKNYFVSDANIYGKKVFMEATYTIDQSLSENSYIQMSQLGIPDWGTYLTLNGKKFAGTYTIKQVVNLPALPSVDPTNMPAFQGRSVNYTGNITINNFRISYADPGEPTTKTVSQMTAAEAIQQGFIGLQSQLDHLSLADFKEQDALSTITAPNISAIDKGDKAIVFHGTGLLGENSIANFNGTLDNITNRKQLDDVQIVGANLDVNSNQDWVEEQFTGWLGMNYHSFTNLKPNTNYTYFASLMSDNGDHKWACQVLGVDSEGKTTQIGFNSAPTVANNPEAQVYGQFNTGDYVEIRCYPYLQANFVMNNPTAPKELLAANNFGAIQSYPVLLYIDGQFYGLMELNTKSSSDLWNIDDSDPNQIAMEANGKANKTGSLWTHEQISVGENGDFALNSDNDANAQVNAQKLDTFLVTSSDDEFKAHLDEHIDVNSVCDYILFNFYVNNCDAFKAKNTNYLTYDGNRWYMIGYDFDATLGNSWQAGQIINSSRNIYVSSVLYRNT